MPLTLRVHGCGMSMAGGVQRRRRLAAVERVDEAEVGARPDVVQFVERVVVALVVGDEQLAAAIERQAHRKAMAGGDRLSVNSRGSSARRLVAAASRRTLP